MSRLLRPERTLALPRFHGARVFHNADQSIPNNTLTVAAFNSERFDTDGYHSTVTNNSRLTIPPGLGGKYAISANAGFASNSSGQRRLRILIDNGAAVADIINQAPASGSWVGSVSTITQLAVGQFVELQVLQNISGGASLNLISSGDFSPELAIAFLG